MSNDEEFDYMSEVFLQEVEPSQGLINSRSAQRNIQISKRKAVMDEENRKKNKPIAKVEESNRQVGLSEPICEDNKGFEMLKKMGFEPGKGLGKSGEGRIDPVSLTVKDDRSGLGRKSELLERIGDVKACLQEARLSDGDLAEFRKRMVDGSHNRQLLSDLAESQRICHQLDLAHGLSQPDEEWYWPPKIVDKEKDGDTDGNTQPEMEDEIPVVEKLKQVTEYLRDVHYYCIWCGTRYRGEIDMSSQCPGDTRDLH